MKLKTSDVVIFTLDNGGTIRDIGREVFYFSHDPRSERIATLYAEKKWGKRLTLEKGRIRFLPEFLRQRKGLSR